MERCMHGRGATTKYSYTCMCVLLHPRPSLPVPNHLQVDNATEYFPTPATCIVSPPSSPGPMLLMWLTVVVSDGDYGHLWKQGDIFFSC